MGIKIVKWVVFLLLLLVILLMSSLAFVVLAPDRAIGLLEYGTGYKISADSLDINASKGSVNADGLLVQAPDGSELLRSEELRAVVDALGAWQGTKPFWDIQIRNAHFYATPADDEPSSPVQLAAPLDFARILGARSVDVDTLTVHAGDNETSYSVSMQRSADNALDLRLSMGKRLTVEGALTYKLGSRTEIDLQLAELDLRELLGSGATEAEAAPATDSSVTEATMDWSWLGMLRSTDLSVQIGKLLLPEQTVSGIDTKLEFAKDGVGADMQLASLLLDAGQELKLDNIKLRADLSTLALVTDGKDLLGKLEIESEGLAFAADGEFNINGSNGNDLALQLELESASGIVAALPAVVATYLPMNVTTELLIDSSNYQVEELKASFGESDLSGNLSLAINDGAPFVRAKLHSETLVLASKGDQAQVETETPAEQAQPTEKTAKVFNDEAIAWDWLEQGDIDVALTAKILQLYDARFNDFQVLAKGAQGTLTIDPLQANFGGGGFSGVTAIEKLETGAAASLTFEMSGVDLEAFGVVPQEQLAGGKTELALQLESRGNSSAEMAGALQGTVHLLVHDAVVQNDSFELIGSDILLETLNKLNPFAKTDPTTKLHCALVHFDIDDGQMNTDKALVVETEKMEIIGDGSVNLDDEILDILITPNAKQTVGLNVGSVVKFMKLGGTLANPSPAVDAGGLLKSGASIGAAVSTGGVSLLAENLVKKVAEQNACRAAMATK